MTDTGATQTEGRASALPVFLWKVVKLALTDREAAVLAAWPMESGEPPA